MGAFPMHPRSLEASFDDVFVGALHHARTNWPVVASELRVLHQHLSFAQVLQMLLHLFVLSKIALETTSHAQQRTGTAMFEHMQTPLEHRGRKMHSRML